MPKICYMPCITRAQGGSYFCQWAVWASTQGHVGRRERPKGGGGALHGDHRSRFAVRFPGGSLQPTCGPRPHLESLVGGRHQQEGLFGALRRAPGALVARLRTVAVGVVAPGQLPVGPRDLRLAGRAAHTQHLVAVARAAVEPLHQGPCGPRQQQRGQQHQPAPARSPSSPSPSERRPHPGLGRSSAARAALPHLAARGARPRGPVPRQLQAPPRRRTGRCCGSRLLRDRC